MPDIPEVKETDQQGLQNYFSEKTNVKQFTNEYSLCWRDQQSKQAELLARLKLYNNQRRDKKAVGDTTMFTIFQTVIASLYNDRLITEWMGKTEGDEEVADNLNLLYENDYEEMEKDEIDYMWDWDALFTGRGLLDFSEFLRDPKRKLYLPMPHLLDSFTFLHDPYCEAVNATKFARSAMRFGGHEIRMTKDEIENHPSFFKGIDFNKLNMEKAVNQTQSFLGDAERLRAEAQGRTYDNMKGEEGLGVNAEYIVTEWYSHIKLGEKIKKVKLWIANERTTVIGATILGEREDLWPIIDRPLYPTAHDWYGTSIPDLTEDKQRGRAVAQNLAKDLMISDLYGTYVFDTNKIKNRNDLSIGMNKFIPVDEGGIEGAIAPVNKVAPNLGLLDFIYTSLDASAQKATATPEIQQGALSSENRTLGELNLVSSKVDTRYSLAAKVFGWSEKRFARQWYKLYKDNYADKIDEKVLRLTGAFGPKWRTLTKENIIATIDPDVRIESKNISRALQLEERAALSEYVTGVVIPDPTSNKRYAAKLLGKKYGLKKEELDFLYPPTIDERIAEKQNVLLNLDETVEVLPEDDHLVHLEIHKKAADTPSTFAHINVHEKALSIKKTNPKLFPSQTQEENTNQFQDQIQPQVQQEQPSRQNMPIAPSQTSGQMIQ